MKLRVNGEDHEIDVAGDMPLLWVLRDELHITGPKYGCGIAMCGACTVHVDGQPVRACVLPAAAVQGEVTTIEWLKGSGSLNGAATTIEKIEKSDGPGSLHAVQSAWIEHQVAQCGYCQPGLIMTAAALLAANPAPTDADIDRALAGHLCRCGTYPRIRRAIHAAAASLAGDIVDEKVDDKVDDTAGDTA